MRTRNAAPSKRFAGLISLFFCSLAASLLAGGCGNNPYPPGESGGKVAYRLIADDPKSLDPSYSYDGSEGLILDVIYPSFYRYDFLKRDPFALELNIGAAEPTRGPYTFTRTDKAGKTETVTGEQYTFRLRPDIRYQDDPCFPGGKGRLVTANDIVYAFKRMIDPSVQSPVASFFADKVVGWEAYTQAFEKQGAKNYNNALPGVQVDPRDPLTFHIYLSQPYPQLRYLMAMHFTAPQAREAVEYWKDEYKLRHPVGCGMYRLSEFKSKQRISLEANPNRYPSRYPSQGSSQDQADGLLRDAGAALPLTDKIVFSVVKEGVTAFNLFQQGYLDVSGVTNTNATQVLKGADLSPEMKRRGVTMRRNVSVNDWYCFFNMEDPDWGGYTPRKRKLRQAVSLSIDSQAFIDVFNRGNGVLAQTMIPPGVFGYDPAYRNPYTQYDESLAKAKQLLAEAGYPDGMDPRTGKPLVLTMDGQSGSPQLAAMFEQTRRQVEKLGIKVDLKLSRYSVWRDKMKKKQFQFSPVFGWSADYPDPENFLFLFYGPNRGGPNSSLYGNPEYDRLFLEMQKMSDGPRRLALIQQLQRIVIEDCPVIPMYHDVTYSLSQAWIRNTKPHPISNDDSQYRAVDPELRAARQAGWNQPNIAPLWWGLAAAVAGIAPALQVIRQRTNRKVRRRGAVTTPEGELD
ncbi:MAG: hypothetical protein H7Z41_19505 [Cytophagales bacterium]|nr:hypothetical protein [Armatimonadota bacterium]